MAMFAAALMLAAAGCGARGNAGGSGLVKAGKVCAVELPERFVSRVDMSYGSLDCGGELELLATGDMRLSLLEPASMRNVVFVLSEGELLAQYEGMSTRVDAAVLPIGAVPNLIRATLDRMDGLTFEAPAPQGPYELTIRDENLGRFKVVVAQGADKKYLPLKISIEDLTFTARLTPKAE